MKKSGLADSPFFSPSHSHSVISVLQQTAIPSPPMFQSDEVRTPERVNGRTDAPLNTRTPEQANTRTDEPPKVSSGKRTIKRQSYNVFVDQHEALQRLEATSMLSGKSLFISEMVRQALDDFLKKHS